MAETRSDNAHRQTEQIGTVDVPYGLPREVKYCTKCIISNQRPLAKKSEFKHDSNSVTETIDFDEAGVCAACRYHEQKMNQIDWQGREKLLWDQLPEPKPDTST